MIRRSPLTLWYVRGRKDSMDHRKLSKGVVKKTGLQIGSTSNALHNANDAPAGLLPNISRENGRFGVPKWAATDKRLHRNEGESWNDWTFRLFSESVEFRNFEGAKPSVSRMETYNGNLQYDVQAGASGMSQQRTTGQGFLAGMRYFDRRIATFNHQDLADNWLKCIRCVFGPDGNVYTTEHFEGSVVCVLIFSESERSLQLMNSLSLWLKHHKKEQLTKYKERTGKKPESDALIEDFMVVCICNMGNGGEHDDMTRRLGFYHLTHTNGATLVMRDMGFKVYPQPKMFILNGTNGRLITRYGYTAFRKNPWSCLQAWQRGEPGMEWYDVFRWDTI